MQACFTIHINPYVISATKIINMKQIEEAKPFHPRVVKILVQKLDNAV